MSIFYTFLSIQTLGCRFGSLGGVCGYDYDLRSLEWYGNQYILRNDDSDDHAYCHRQYIHRQIESCVRVRVFRIIPWFCKQ